MLSVYKTHLHHKTANEKRAPGGKKYNDFMNSKEVTTTNYSHTCFEKTMLDTREDFQHRYSCKIVWERTLTYLSTPTDICSYIIYSLNNYVINSHYMPSIKLNFELI